MGLQGKVSLVTGAARGIGRAIALLLAEHGSHVVVNDLLEKEGPETVQAIQKLGVKALWAKADISNEQEVKLNSFFSV